MSYPRRLDELLQEMYDESGIPQLHSNYNMQPLTPKQQELKHRIETLESAKEELRYDYDRETFIGAERYQQERCRINGEIDTLKQELNLELARGIVA